MTLTSEPRVLYIAYWGAAEPLGQSLVLPALKKLSECGARVVLVSFEKPVDLADSARIDDIRTRLKQWNVGWLPLRYHKWPKIPATAFDILHGCARSLLIDRDFRFNIVHARTYIGGLIGFAVARLSRTKYIFHNEGFYPDEQVDGGVWRRGSLPHRIAKHLERHMYAAADGLITLSHRARSVVEDLPEVVRRATPVIVVPSCVDTGQFQCVSGERNLRTTELRLVYIGSIGNRYIFDRIAQFVAVAHRELGPIAFRVLTRVPARVVDAALRSAEVPDGTWSVDSVPHSAVPDELKTQDAGLFFLTQGLSEHGCSPTKIGEYWASGLPVITTPNVSDTDKIVHEHRVGVIVRDHTPEAYQRAARELRALIDDPDTPQRCRTAAAKYYNLSEACERQMNLYQQVLSQRDVKQKTNHISAISRRPCSETC